MNVVRVLQLSTAHWPNSAPIFGNIRKEETDFGTILWLYPEINFEKDLTDWFQPIYKLAESLGCSMIEFDRDEEILEDLKYYSW